MKALDIFSFKEIRNYLIWLGHKLGALTDILFFILLFILTALEHHGVWWPLNSAASNNSVRVKVELKESFFKLTFHYWQPPFDHSTITFKNFVSLYHYLNFQDFCKSLTFSFQRQIPVYSPIVICCRRSVIGCHPSFISIHSPSPLSLRPLTPFTPPSLLTLSSFNI